jgi:superfamily II DNA or RNA helicase
MDDIKYIQPNLITDEPAYDTWLHRARKIYDRLTSDNPQLEYREYQYKYAALYALRNRNLCAGSCGMGKTIIVGLLLATVYNEGFTRPGQIHIVAPNHLSITSRWLHDLNLFAEFKDQVEYIKSESQILKSKKPIWVYTQDFPKRNSKLLSKTRSNRNQLAYLMIRQHRTPKTLVIDEVHLIKPNTQRTAIWKVISNKAKRIFTMSGTISDGRLDLIHTILHITYDSYFQESYSSFNKTYGAHKRIETNYIGGTEFIIDTNTRYLNELAIDKVPAYSHLARRYIHRVALTDPEVYKDITLPQCITHKELCVPHTDHRNYYRLLVDEYKTRLVKAVESNANLVGTLSLISPLLIASNLPPLDIENKKLERLTNIIASSTKTVIFTQFVAVARYITNHLDQLYPNRIIRLYANDPEVYPATLSPLQRSNRLAEFLYNDDIKAGVFSINLASESIDLNNADTIIFYDLPWQAIKIQQAIFRAVRPGNPFSRVAVHYLINHGFIDQHQYTLFEEKIKSSKLVIDWEASSRRGMEIKAKDTIQVIKDQLMELI